MLPLVLLLTWIFQQPRGGSATPTPAPTPAPTTVVFQQDLNGYTGVVDVGNTFISTTYRSTNPEIRAWRVQVGSAPHVGLLYFNLSSIPANAICSSMYLTTWWNTTTTSVPYISQFGVFRALRPWDASTSSYSINVTNPEHFDNATGSFYGNMLLNLGSGVLGNLTLETSNTGGCWISRTCPNTGFAIFSTGTSGSSVPQYFMSSEAAPLYRPMLTVTYYESTPTFEPTPGPTALPTASPTALPTATPTLAPTPAPTPLVSARARKRHCAA